MGRAIAQEERIRSDHRIFNMASGNIVIRRETEKDLRVVESLVRESFWNVYRPGCLEHYVLHRLRDDPAFVPELDFVMERDGVIIGQNVFVRAVIRSDDGRDVPIMTMGPICIAPEFKRQGHGKMLLDFSLEKAAAFGCGALCFEGNIGFYGKSGFAMRATSAFATTGFRRGRTPLSSFARNWCRGISQA